jgi:transposase
MFLPFFRRCRMDLISKQPDFSGQTIYSGIDTHKVNWKVTTCTNDIHLKTFSMNPSPSELYKYMCSHYPNGKYVSVYEAGFCGYWIHRELTKYSFKNIIVNPSDVPSTNKERDRKSDPIDSAKLSRELAKNSLTGIFVPDVHHESMRSLNRLYKQNTRRTTQIKNRIKGYLHFTGTKLPVEFDRACWSNNFLTFLSNIKFPDPIAKIVMDTHLDDLKHARKTRSTIFKQIRKAAKEVPVIKLLITVPGVGLLTAYTLYAELVDIHRFKNLDNLASYVGLVPSTQSSGTTLIVNGMSNRHCQHLRSALIESAWIAVRNDSALLYSFNELAKKMKKTDAIIRIARKLLNRICFVWKNNKPYVTGTLEVSKNPKPK